MNHILMIKKCMTTGLKYLCKTESTKIEKDPMHPYKYKGSGIRWTNHIKKHNSYIITCVIGNYATKEELIKQGIYYSQLYNVANSNEWANLTEEKGDGGLIGLGQLGKRWKMSEEAKANINASRQEMIKDGRMAKRMAKTAEQIKGTDNYQFKGWYVTPWGTFATNTEAIKAAKVEREKGNKLVISDQSALRKYCITENDKVINGVSCKVEWKGKTPKQLGFGFIRKDNDE